MTLAAAKVAFVILFGFCSVVDKHCGLIAVHPDKAQTYDTQTECQKDADKLDKDKARQLKMLEPAASPPPFDIKIACGKPEQLAQTAEFLNKWNAVMDNRQAPPQAKPEAPGDRDPFPDGG